MKKDYYCSGCGKKFMNWIEVFYMKSEANKNILRAICFECVEEEAYYDNSVFDLQKSQKLLEETHKTIIEKLRT